MLKTGTRSVKGFILMGFVFLWSVISVNAVTFTVTKTADTSDGACDADCSLREAVTAANSLSSNDEINFDASVFGTHQIIILGGQEIMIGNGGSLVINGTGRGLLTISGNSQSRVFTVGSGSAATIKDVEIALGNGVGAIMSGAGGGLLVQQGGTLSLNNAAVSFNSSTLTDTAGLKVPALYLNQDAFRDGKDSISAGFVSGGGGGIFNLGNLFLKGTLVSDNFTTASGSGALGGGGGIHNVGTAELIDSTVDSNRTFSVNGAYAIAGAGIYNGFQSTFNLINSTVSNNTGRGNGGGINNNAEATLNIINSTVSANRAETESGSGGGILNFATVKTVHATIAGNFAEATFSGVYNSGQSAVFTSKNSIFADNAGPVSASNFAGYLTSEGYNLLETTNGTAITGVTTGNILNVDPQLLPLGNYGGPTKTHALRPTSPAIDKGSSFGVTADQRGRPRPFDNPFIANAEGGDGSDIGAFERQLSDIPKAAPYDFDGDNKTDVGIFRPSDGSWWYSRSSDNAFRVYNFGTGTDIITPGDFTGDGKSDISVFRPSTGEWFVQRSEDNSFFSFPFGASGDIPAPSDYDGDGKTDAAVFRPSNSTWYIRRSSDLGTTIVSFGTAEDKPVPADFEGDGKSDIAIFRPSDGSWWYLQSSNAQYKVYRFGVSTDKPVQGDYTGDGKADIAVFRPSTGEWFVQRSEDNSFYSVPFGASGDTPVPGDYDGDGKFDTAVFRPSTADWFVNRSTVGILITTFGTSGDRPIPNAFVP
ncbi:MAG TPA: FG-GAP-like repeat-containing protein [Pyrinomonadaceae bacterium]|nr:FG-GAP-like repeat-containing protein [Pyrinomonadaceae bacterium]